MNSYKFNVQCPHCRFKQTIVTDMVNNPMSNHSEIINCDAEEGGCDLEFAIKWQLYPRYESYTLNPLKVS